MRAIADAATYKTPPEWPFRIRDPMHMRELATLSRVSSILYTCDRKRRHSTDKEKERRNECGEILGAEEEGTRSTTGHIESPRDAKE